MGLDDSQKVTVREWIESGLDLSEIQSKLQEDLGVSMTYMEVRFLVDDLGVMPKDPDPEPDPEAEVLPADSEAPGENLGGGAASDPPTELSDPFGEKPAGGGVSVTVDQVTRAGALASGKVTFSDGKSAGWTLDQMGRLGLSADDPGYKPSQDDVMEFQVQLQQKLSGPRF